MTHKIKFTLLIVFAAISFEKAFTQTPQGARNKASIAGQKNYISTKKAQGAFTISFGGKSSPIVVSLQDYPGVLRAANSLREDIGRVTTIEPLLIKGELPPLKEVILIGTLGKNPLVDKLVADKKLDVGGIVGKWESHFLQVVEKPFPNVDRALVIAGSDKRGTIFGIYDLSASIGVSPWYWWADVPARKKPVLYVLPGKYSDGEPAVKYRGIFINDEAPALSGWTFEKFGGFNHKLYGRVFELILRLKGNFLWPAMWGRAFYDDDPENPRLADEFGVVIGTSHHEPMMRAHDEWRRYGKGGKWNYEKNDSSLREFWAEGIRRMGSYESIVTLAMRGDGDEPMSDDANVALLERIVKDQRRIVTDVRGKDVAPIPQVWALYKEVQEYYDKGMRVPDDVTLLLCDDNWGNIRKLPKLTDPPRAGGYGIYYHFDYVGAPRNYKWVNTNQISRTWEQMHLAYEFGARRIWIVNVGDIKPMEFPISFFLEYAWNPDAWPAAMLPDYTRSWAEQQFGSKYSKEIADILTAYTKFNSRRKPELLSPETYSTANYREAETIVDEYKKVAVKAERLARLLPPECRDAYFQLVLHPVTACSNLNELYFTVAKNHLYAKQGRAGTNSLAKKAAELYARDSSISFYYNKVLANGKWSHMMDQTHIGYTYWQQPDKNAMPEVKMIEIPVGSMMGVAVEGSTASWPQDTGRIVLPEFDSHSDQSFYIEIFNRGKSSFEYSVNPEQPYIRVSPSKGKVDTEIRVHVSVDWKRAPAGKNKIPIRISTSNGNSAVAEALINNAPPIGIGGFVESNGAISMEAEHFSRAVKTDAVSWLRIPDFGRTSSGMTVVPVTASEQPPGQGPRLEYDLELFSSGEVKVIAFCSPTVNFHNKSLRYAISIDDEIPQVVKLWDAVSIQDWKYPNEWMEAVSNNIRTTVSRHSVSNAGRHVLKFWMVDPGIVLQKLVVDTGSMRNSYLGPPESYRNTGKKGKGK